MRQQYLIIAALLFINSAVFSQGQLDAYRYAQTDLRGTARYMSMGGAFGALGGDISAMSSNPAGLAVYRSSEVVTTLNFQSTTAKTDWMGTAASANRTRFNFDNIGYVGYFPTSNDAGVLSWNMGFSYNRLKDYHRNYKLQGIGNSNYSLTDYLAERANRSKLHKDNMNYDQTGDWQSVLGYKAGFIDAFSDAPDRYTSAFGEQVGNTWYAYPLAGREMTVKETGAIDQYNIAMGMNISDFLLLGANIVITDINYRYSALFSEDFENRNYLTLDNWLETNGSGYAFNAGLILRPVNFLRLGVAYNSPTWYKMTDHYGAFAESDSYYWTDKIQATAPDDDSNDPGYFEYRFRSPDKWIFSAAFILGQSALLSVDYELVGYNRTKVYNIDGIETAETNSELSTNFGTVGSLRVGGEVKVTPQFAVRAGAAFIGNPMKDALRQQTTEVVTVGTIPHYTIENSITNYTVGLGYRFTPRFYMDLACVLKTQKEDLYIFSKMFDGTNPNPVIDPGMASLKTNTTRIALTLGYKF